MTDIIDMAQFTEARSDQLNADDLIGAPRTVTVTKVTGCEGDQPIAIHYDGDKGKPFKPCKTIRRVLMGVWGRAANEYVGRSMRLYRDDSVSFGGLQVGGIRISHMSHIDKDTIVVVNKSKGKKAGIKIEPLRSVQQQPAAQMPTDKRGKAVAWIDWYENELKVAPDRATLDEVHAKAKQTAERIKREFPDLYVERLSSMLPMAASDGFDTPADTLAQDNPSAAEGRADQDRGEQLFEGAE